MAQAKVGLNLTAYDMQQGQLATGIRAVATDPGVWETAQKLAAQFARLGGVQKAADLLVELAVK